MTTARKSRNWVFFTAIIVFVLYAAWMLAPYLRSILVRDASVTSWAQTVNAPVAGTIISDPPTTSGAIGDEGHVVRIRNDRLFREAEAVLQHRIQQEHALERVHELETYASELDQLIRDRAKRTERYAAVFIERLEASKRALEQEVDILAAHGPSESENDLEPAPLNTAATTEQVDVEEHIAQLQAELSDLDSRLQAAADGVFLESDGSDPSWAHVADLGLEAERLRIRLDIAEAQALHKEATSALEAQEAEYQKLREADIVIPSHAEVYEIEVGKGSTVAAGDILLRWVDCDNLLVDVPVSDAELPLIRPGSQATILLEGESEERIGTVHLTRGSSATLDERTLAAVAKGRHEGLAQVLVDLGETDLNGNTCPLGNAAYVEFPDVGLFDVIRARLRL
ncbi:HlyD family efflux transporter periplasmic adaptor subunit [Pseudoruegeria sp. HB172150]|uniref:HlyD family efflux transporter periplasmic adaptor subunit n=1 Tax=Pseudoruegeria sp. HB172150 TaxID=2721164 RepID=UPI001555F18B|nr:HlyD family secretion protein [Pseudoruegeria sp. HB172150]